MINQFIGVNQYAFKCQYAMPPSDEQYNSTVHRFLVIVTLVCLGLKGYDMFIVHVLFICCPLVGIQEEV